MHPRQPVLPFLPLRHACGDRVNRNHITSHLPNYALQIRALPLAIPSVVISMFLHVAGVNDT